MLCSMHDSQTQISPLHTLHFTLIAATPPQRLISQQGCSGTSRWAVAGLSRFVLVIFFCGDDDIPFLFDRVLACQKKKK
jgi:hypothetical protein